MLKNNKKSISLVRSEVKQSPPYICAAGVSSINPEEKAKDCLNYYFLQHEVDALINDAVMPSPKPKLAQTSQNRVHDYKHREGHLCDVAKLINPPSLTKFQTVVDDVKCTYYQSYWKKPLGHSPDPTPMLPAGMDISRTTFGKIVERDDERQHNASLKLPYSEGFSPKPDVNLNHPNNNHTHGKRSFADESGTQVKRCLSEQNTECVTMSTIHKTFRDRTKPAIGKSLSPCSNINEVLEGYCFGIKKQSDDIKECLTDYSINPEKDFIKKCFQHLIIVRRRLSKFCLSKCFKDFYLNLKYLDKDKTGWLPVKVVYNFCRSKCIVFDRILVEPLLSCWDILVRNECDSFIKYKTFLDILNYTVQVPALPVIRDPLSHAHYSTTYSDLVKSGLEVDTKPAAGLPTDRYLDYDIIQLPTIDSGISSQKEYLSSTGVQACVNPSILTKLGGNHRLMYKPREPNVVRKVFAAAGENLPDEKFRTVWEIAKNYNSQGLVCFETFRRALKTHLDANVIQRDTSINKF